MNYSTDRPIETGEQDLLGLSLFFRGNLERQYMNTMEKMDW